MFLALGHTVSEIDVSLAKGVFDKTVFSMVIPEVETILKDEESRKSVVLFGIEVRMLSSYSILLRFSLQLYCTIIMLVHIDSSMCPANCS